MSLRSILLLLWVVPVFAMGQIEIPDRGAFDQSYSSAQRVKLENQVGVTLPNNWNYSGGVGYTSAGSGGSFYVDGITVSGITNYGPIISESYLIDQSSQHLLNGIPTILGGRQLLTITLPAGTVAFGMDMGQSTGDPLVQVPSVTLNDGSTISLSARTTAFGSSSFLGFENPTGIRSVSLSVGLTGLGAFPSANNIWYATVGSEEKSGGDGGPDGKSTGEPINIATGNVYDTITDYESSGAHTLAFRRLYNSIVPGRQVPGAMGGHWNTNYDRSILLNLDGSVSVAREDGQILRFNAVGGGFQADSDVSMSLTKAGSTFTLKTEDDSTETYQIYGTSLAALVTVRDRSGYSQTWSRSSGGQLMAVVDSYARTLKFQYSGDLLSSVLTPEGTTISFGYDFSGVNSTVKDRLRTVTYSGSPSSTQTYLYENPLVPFARTAVIDEMGNRYASWTYDAVGRGLSSSLGNNSQLTTIAYNDSDRSRVVTGPLGQQETYHFTVIKGSPKISEVDRASTSTTAAASTFTTYDSNGYKSSETDWNGNLTTYVNDSLGRPTKIVEAAGTPLQRTSTTTYNGNLHLPLTIIAPQLTTKYTYDSTGNVLTKTLTDTSTASTKGQKRVWTYTWANGLMTSATTPRGFTTNFRYVNGALSSTTDPLLHTKRTTQRTVGGLPLTVVDENGVSTLYRYDSRQRLVLIRKTLASVGLLSSTFTYDLAGDRIAESDPGGLLTSSTFDSAHQLTSISNKSQRKISFTLDAMGNQIASQTTGSTSSLAKQGSASFDALGRKLSRTGGVGQVTTYVYDANGNVVKTLDPLGRPETRSYDALNRLVKITDALGQSTFAAYNTRDLPTAVRAGSLTPTFYVYSGFGDILVQTSPDAGSVSYTYDADGNLIHKVDANGTVSDMSYDALDRLLTVSYPADTSQNVTYTYDESGHGFSIGRLTTVSDRAGILSRSYEERGAVSKEVRSLGAANLTTQYTYDLAGNPATITYPSGLVVTYRRDALEHITQVIAQEPGLAAITLATPSGYLPFGGATILTLGNGVVETRKFDLDYRLSRVSVTGTLKIEDLQYGLDLADNVKTITDGVVPANSQSFTYSAVDRLTSAHGSYGILGYTYDSVGNRLTQVANAVSTQYSIRQKSNQLTALVSGGQTQTLAYTPAGSLSSVTGSSGMSLSYDLQGRLSQVSSGAQPLVTNLYDAMGRRISKATGTGTTLFQYNPGGLLTEEATLAGSALRDYVYLDGRPLAVVAPVSGNVAYIHVDSLGTPLIMTDSHQAVIWKAIYTPFGAASVTGSATLNFRLPGQYYDAETGFAQNGFRDYAASLGRYIESDPIGIGGGINTFSYSDANPIVRVDRSGSDWIYAQSTGDMVHVDPDSGTLTYLGSGYSGNSSGLNNPSMQYVKDTGPIQQGSYIIGDISLHYINDGNRHIALPDSMRLNPEDGQADRGYLIHGSNDYANHTGSKGCIILTPKLRESIGASDDRMLRVVRNLPESWYGAFQCPQSGSPPRFNMYEALMSR